LERRTARKPNEVGAAETIETFAVAQQHVEDAVLGERAAELGKTEIQGLAAVARPANVRVTDPSTSRRHARCRWYR
jgi:hypothetical protein